MSSILFFLGILMAVAALESLGLLFHFAEGLDNAIPNQDIVVMILGVGSAIIDNVPLVAASKVLMRRCGILSHMRREPVEVCS